MTDVYEVFFMSGLLFLYFTKQKYYLLSSIGDIQYIVYLDYGVLQAEYFFHLIGGLLLDDICFYVESVANN